MNDIDDRNSKHLEKPSFTALSLKFPFVRLELVAPQTITQLSWKDDQEESYDHSDTEKELGTEDKSADPRQYSVYEETIILDLLQIKGFHFFGLFSHFDNFW